jgi:hypothetical protein
LPSFLHIPVGCNRQGFAFGATAHILVSSNNSSVAHAALRRATPLRIGKNVSAARHGYSALCQFLLAHAMTRPNVIAFKNLAE